MDLREGGSGVGSSQGQLKSRKVRDGRNDTFSTEQRHERVLSCIPCANEQRYEAGQFGPPGKVEAGAIFFIGTDCAPMS